MANQPNELVNVDEPMAAGALVCCRYLLARGACCERFCAKNDEGDGIGVVSAQSVEKGEFGCNVLRDGPSAAMRKVPDRDRSRRNRLGWQIHVMENQMAIPAGMGRQVTVVLYVVAMAVVIVGVDFAFFRNRFWERLTVNIGIVLVFAAFYLRFLRRP